MGKTSNVNCVRRTNTTVYRRGVRIDTNNDCIMDLTYEVDSKNIHKVFIILMEMNIIGIICYYLYIMI